ncbi:hypothetical protein HHK36_009313 [Tetracentron sinense]|uniref:Uncharacterized protein n=1 Tax=Tetracentron sinense TaxID=13715 RepID=A0A835DI66_TETSI|nr:hypothetical protein HHK36_009313 [Tetracentron sinense]
MAFVELEGAGLLEAQADILNLSLNFINFKSLKCAVQLGIPDFIHHHGQAITLSELVKALSIPSTKTDCLRRLMRILVHSGFIARDTNQNEEETYLLTLSSRLLVKENSMNMLAYMKIDAEPAFLLPWNSWCAWFKQAESTCFEMANGTSLWDLASQHPELNNHFNETMASDSRLLMTVVVRDYSEIFRGMRSLVDVGGGTGTSTRIISEAFPHMKCTILDLPHVVPESTKLIDSIGGDMFEFIPQADVILLKSILHDWNDVDCVKILKRCKEAIPSKKEGGKVIILDLVLNDDETDDKNKETQLLFDMFMMVTVGSKERSEDEWQKIFTVAGFTEYKIKPVLGIRSIIEIYP